MKTLKDLEITHHTDKKICLSDELREVAKEWIKAIYNSPLVNPPEGEPVYDVHVTGYCCGNECYGDIECIEWIKHFFNLEDK